MGYIFSHWLAADIYNAFLSINLGVGSVPFKSKNYAVPMIKASEIANHSPGSIAEFLFDANNSGLCFPSVSTLSSC